MSQYYQIGLTADNLVNLEDDPFPETTSEEIGFTLSGSPLNVALDTITWKWKNMSQLGWYQIWLFWVNNIQVSNPPPFIFIRTLNQEDTDFTYGIYRCKMGKPKSTVTVALAEVRDAEVSFFQAEQVG
jgi:hypothetical protein